jgi:hypothetical protein
MLKILANKYFELFSNKNIKAIAEMFSEEIALHDWEINVIGKSNVLQVTKNIFDSVKSIQVKPINVYCENNTIIAELKIIVNKVEELFVVDIIEFDINNKIVDITAYKK